MVAARICSNGFISTIHCTFTQRNAHRYKCDVDELLHRCVHQCTPVSKTPRMKCKEDNMKGAEGGGGGQEKGAEEVTWMYASSVWGPKMVLAPSYL